ncbi:MAG: transposase [Planctomycetota bacterium]
MVLPRRVVESATYLITRRCTDRRFYLLPHREVLELLWYCVAYPAMLYGVEVHALVFMSNHVHLVISDPERNLPEFMHWFCQKTGAALNQRYGQTGTTTIWESHRRYTSIRQIDSDALERALLYTLMNPVSSGLVRTASAWRDAVTLPEAFGTTRLVPRPKRFFRQKGKDALPEEVPLTLTCPALLRDRYPTDDAYRAAFNKLLRDDERRVQRELRALGRSFFGWKRVLQQRPTDQPSYKPAAYEPLRWTFQCTHPDLRRHLEGEELSWRARTHAAYGVFKDPETRPEARFPRDSYQWVRHLGAEVEDEVPPDD